MTTEDVQKDAIEPTPEIVFGLEKGGAVRYPRLEIVPAGTKVYTTEELGDLKLKELEEIYWEITGKTPEPKFRTKVAGVFTIVQEVLKYPLVDEQAVQEKEELAALEENIKEAKAAARYGPPKRKNITTYELLSHSDKSMFIKMPPQAVAVLQIIVDEVVATQNNKIDHKRMAELMEERKADFNTRQHSWRIFSYYKSSLISRNILREH